MTLLETLRGRRRLAARLLAPLLCAAWLGAFGCPCVMAADLGDPGAIHEHGRCPFCPMGDAHGLHAGCSTVRNAADQMPQAVALNWNLSHALPVAETPALGMAPIAYRLARHELYPGVHAPPIPLNLRYCVFLN